MNCCGGFASYPQQGTKGIGSTPEMRKLANILYSVSLLDLKGEILKPDNEAKKPDLTFSTKLELIHILQWLLYTLEQDMTIFHTRGLHSPTTRILSASSSTGCFWLGLCFRRPVTSTAQPNVSNLIWEQQKAVSYFGGPTDQNLNYYVREWSCKYLRVIQVWTGNNLQWLQRAPVIHMKKEVFLLGSNRANPSLQRSIGKKRLYFNMYDPALLKWSIKKHRLMFLLMYCQ